jgi:hypothetical protein
MLVLMTEDHERLTSQLLDLYGLHTGAEIECRKANPNSAVLGQIAFIAEWTPERRQQFLDGLAEAMDEARRLATIEPVTFYIQFHRPFSGPTPTKVDPDFTRRLGETLQRHLRR